MREASSYRGARRNAARRQKNGLRLWRETNNAAYTANVKAKIDVRREQCAGAIEAVSKAIANAIATGEAHQAKIMTALRDYWGAIVPRTRVISRILRELPAA